MAHESLFQFPIEDNPNNLMVVLPVLQITAMSIAKNADKWVVNLAVGPMVYSTPFETQELAAEFIDLWSDRIEAALRPDHGPMTSATTAVEINATTPTTIAAANIDRKQLIVTNSSGALVYIKLGLGATDSDYTVRMNTNDVFATALYGYTGVITAVRGSGTGTVLVTEIT